jgi:hypothetical protein
MHWEDIQRFDETNPAHVQALKEHCMQSGQLVYTIQKKQGRSPSLSDVSEFAYAFGCNMSIDDRFPSEQLHLESGGSEYWWKWVQQIAEWWLAGYNGAPSDDQIAGT